MLRSMGRPIYPQAELAERLRKALYDARVKQVDLARACGVTEQAVYSWLTTGRIAKEHLPTISALTGKGLDYFLVGLKTWRRAAALALALLVPLVLMAPDESRASQANSVSNQSGLCIMVKRLWMRIILFFQCLACDATFCELSQTRLQNGTAR